jgi:phosphatidylinositol alpha 1,6-mannosyltransferase
LEKKLIEKGKTNFKFVIVGEGNEREWLEKNMATAEFTGFLDGEQLSAVYANMDAFVFPSETDTFGNVAQEANASGVPAIVTNQGGPKFIIKHNESGFIAENLDDFVKFSLELMDNPEKLATMKQQSRQSAMKSSWDAVFESVYDAYREAIVVAEEQNRLNGKVK